MKKIFYLLSLFALTSLSAYAQDGPGAARLAEKMAEYIEKKLEMNKSEIDRFHPQFLEYHKEVRKIHQENRDDRLVMQQKLADLRVRYREIFKGIIGDKKSNEVFHYEREFVREAQELRKERRDRRGID